RITKGDALAVTQNRGAPERTDTEASPATEVAGPVESLAPAAQDGRVVRKKMSPLRRKIAQQLVMAQHNAAILTTFNECDMSEVKALRDVYNFERRRLWLAPRHANFESATKRNSGDAQNHGAPDRSERCSGSAPNDVSRSQL